MLRKLEYKPMCLYLDWLEDRLFAEFNYSCVDSLADFNHLQEKAVTKEGLIKARGGKHEKDDRPEIRGKEHYVLGWDNKEKIAVLQAEVRQLQQEEKMTAAKVRKLEEDIKNAQKKRETYYKPQNKMFHFCKTFCSKITLVNTIQNVILNTI